MKKVKVNMDNFEDDELKPFIKEEMTRDDIALLGHYIIKEKFRKLKYKLFGWYYERFKKTDKE